MTWALYCSKCGAAIETGARLCALCGAPVSTNTEPLSANNPDEIITEPEAEHGAEAGQQVQSLIPLVEGETILWHKETTQGLIQKKVILEEAVTNKRCLKYDAENKKIIAQIGITRWPEVVAMNLHRVNDSLGGGVFLTPRMFGLPRLGGFGVYGGPRRGILKAFGDISFLNQGKVVMSFENVKDPRGVKQLVEALKREQGFQGAPGAGRVRPLLGRRFREP